MCQNQTCGEFHASALAEKEEKTTSDSKSPKEKAVSAPAPKEKPLFSRAIQKDFADKAKNADVKQPENEKSAI